MTLYRYDIITLSLFGELHHALLRDGYLLHDACHVGNDDVALLLVLDKSQKFAELIAETMAARFTLVGDRLFVSLVKREGIEDAHRTVHLDVAVLSLDAAVGESVGILRCAEHSQGSRVVAEQGTTDVNAVVPAVAVVANGTRRPEQTDGEAEVVDVQVGQSAAGHRGVEDGSQFAAQVAVVAAAALGIVAMHHPDLANQGQDLLQLTEKRHVEQRERR